MVKRHIFDYTITAVGDATEKDITDALRALELEDIAVELTINFSEYSLRLPDEETVGFAQRCKEWAAKNLNHEDDKDCLDLIIKNCRSDSPRELALILHDALSSVLKNENGAAMLTKRILDANL